ncbi:SipW-dependent-type signal peptide-containing protein [Dietzia sp. B32]|uniref:SipW-dependent-type signal peptide-containing protein n=1 Tax=Dietzia sp. B32 TaxID=2915130 RepID=UPI0021AE161F|nr:SipW-dependent-type signal peptide-containing protein [Dietzia sp. B32]UVE96390.1 SipW-dependent-type signal peptide-containing protein [Dietzia sp. B32]
MRAVSALGMIFGLGAVGTTATWSQTVTAETGLFSTGSVDLKINGASPSFSFARVLNLKPTGGTSDTAGMITLRNDGAINLKYLMDMQVRPLTTGVATAGSQRGDAAALGNNLTMDVFAGGTGTATTCTGGTPLVTARVLTADSTTRGLLTTHRTIDRAGTDALCFRVSLKSTAPITTRMAQVGVTFTVNAEVK